MWNTKCGGGGREGGVRDTTAWEGNDKRLGIGGQVRLRHGNSTA